MLNCFFGLFLYVTYNVACHDHSDPGMKRSGRWNIFPLTSQVWHIFIMSGTAKPTIIHCMDYGLWILLYKVCSN